MSTEDSLHWPLVRAYLDEAAAGHLVVPECENCGENHFPPRVLCPYCLSSSLELREVSGKGWVYSFSVVHLEYHPTWGEETPYVNALIELEDGPVVFGNIVDCDAEAIAVGDAVSVTFEEVSGETLPMFVPAEEKTQ